MQKSAEIISACALLKHTSINYLYCTKSGLPTDSNEKPIMLCLHGFPENSWTWEAYLQHYASDFKVYAADLPGYNFSPGFVAEKDYALGSLIDTLAEFITKIAKGKKVVLLAHDWGGAIAWPLCAFYPELIDKLVIINAAHPSTFTREMLSNSVQQKRSSYISELISKNGYQLFSSDNYLRLKRLYGKSFKLLSEKQRDAFKTMWADQDSMQRSFLYYKNMPVLVTKETKKINNEDIPRIHIKVPTLVLWGMKDTAFVPEVLNGLEIWVEDLCLVKFDDEDHWLHHQKFVHVVNQINSFIEATN